MLVLKQQNLLRYEYLQSFFEEYYFLHLRNQVEVTRA